MSRIKQKPIGSVWRWHPLRAGYRYFPEASVVTVRVRIYPGDDAPHHLAPTGRWPYIVEDRSGSGFYATDDSLSPHRGRRPAWTLESSTPAGGTEP